MQDESEDDDHSVGEGKVQPTVDSVGVGGAAAVDERGCAAVGVEQGAPLGVDGQLEQLTQQEQQPHS
jgi:hypothetical protein